MRFDRVAGLAALSAILMTHGEIRAQSTDISLAEALFQDGRELLAAGKTSEACAKFAASQRIDAKLGTLLNLAACHETEGKTATAWAEFTQAQAQAARADQAEREEFAREHLGALTPRLSRVRITADQPGQLVVRIDGVEVERAALGTSIPVDPGSHVLIVTALGKKNYERTIDVPGGPSLTEIAVPALEDIASVPARPRPSPAPKPHVPPAPPAEISRTPAWIALGLGTAGLGVGSYLGVRAFALKDQAETECDASGCSNLGIARYDSAEVSAHGSTIGFGVGLAAVAVGVYLLLRSPTHDASSKTAASLWPTNDGVRATW